MNVLGIVFLAAATVALPAATPTPAARGGPPTDPLAVVHRWDARRAAAYRAQAPRRLRRLYVAGSPAAAADVASLRAYRRRGVRVTAMAPQVFGIRVLVRTRSRLRVQLTGRVGATGADGRRCRRLPTSPVSTRELTLRRRHGRWLMAAVRAVGPPLSTPGRPARPRAPR